jgi:hypothetical protein
MTPRQALVSAAVALLITFAILLEWVALPPNLGAAESKTASVTAHFRPGRGGHAVLADPSGWHAEVRCGRVRPLCERLQSRQNLVLELRLVRVGLLDDIWVTSAIVDGQELLRLQEREQAFGRSKAVHLAVASIFLLAAATFGAFFYTARRASRSSAAGS